MTDNHREDYAKEAAQDARAAFREGQTQNPHPPGTFEYNAWEDAWVGAHPKEEEE